MADLGAIGQMLQGVGAGFSGNLPQYMYAQQQQQETDFLKDKARREALIQDFATGYSLINNGQVDAAKELFTNRVKEIGRLGGDPSDTLGILTRLNAGKVEEVAAELGSFVQAGMLTGAISSPNAQGGMASAKTRQFVDGTVQMVLPDGSVQVILPNGQPVQGEMASAALQQAMNNEVMYAGQKSGAMAGAQQNARFQYAAPIAGAEATAKASVEAATAPQIAAATEAAKGTAKAGVDAEQAKISSVKQYNALDVALSNYEKALSETVPVPFGDNARFTASQQAAQLARKQVGTALKNITRGSGEGVFAKDDREAMMGELPGISDYGSARQSGFDTLRSRAKAGLNLPQDYSGKGKTGGVLQIDANGNKAIVYPDGSFEEQP